MLATVNSRTPIKAGTVTNLGSQAEYGIGTLIGCGASCLVYRAETRDPAAALKYDRTVIIKELYPAELATANPGISREKNGFIKVPEQHKEAFAVWRTRFEKAISESFAYYEQTTEHTRLCPKLVKPLFQHINQTPKC